jgi:uncharacterized protein YdeI (YjbR/CyaY-like superfamily)
MAPKSELPTLFFESQAAWRKWLAANHAKAPGVWIKYARKAAGVKSITYAEAVEEALCHGWIDGQAQSGDETYYLQRFTPRAARSKWSQINRAKALALIEAGRMKPAGLREVERAKADGRWEAAYESPSAAQVPEDLAKALAKSKRARAFFDQLDGRNRYAILHRLHGAKKPETRARRLAKFVDMLKEGRKIYP